jgi:hypothetical protein
MIARRRWTWNAGTAGAALCMVALVLLLMPSLLAAAIGIELIALAFWLWARADEHASEQVRRWQWLRRPAMAVWVAFAVHAASPSLRHVLTSTTGFRAAPLTWIEAAALVWAGLELVAALPLARPYSDFPGPYVSARPWLPVVLPSTGFLLLWNQSNHWTSVPAVGHIATVLLILTALLAALRAFARRGWTVSLRWLSVAHSALALVLLSEGVVAGESALLIWLGAFGGPAFILAGELAGASPRRGAFNARLWRAASFVSTASLGWPVLMALAPRPVDVRIVGFVVVSVALAISTWIMVGRLEVAPERRRLMRPGSGITVSRVAGVLTLLLGPIGLTLAWWEGFEPHWAQSAVAFAPFVLGAGLAVGKRRRRGPQIGPLIAAVGKLAKPLAAAAYRSIIGWERGVLRVVLATARVVFSPVRDLHTGDAQEYLLFLAGVGVLALLLPLLR